MAYILFIQVFFIGESIFIIIVKTHISFIIPLVLFLNWKQWVLIYMFSFLMYSVYRRVGRRNLVLGHSIPHWMLNFPYIICEMGFNVAFYPYQSQGKWIINTPEWESNWRVIRQSLSCCATTTSSCLIWFRNRVGAKKRIFLKQIFA